MIDVIVFACAAAMCLAGAIGVVAYRNPVYNALSLVLTLFGVAVLFVSREAHFLAVVQVIVYAGAIVVLFLFVIMLLGVDKAEELALDSVGAQRPAAVVFGLGSLALIVTMIVASDDPITGAGNVEFVDPEQSNVSRLAFSLFDDFVYAFELTSVLLLVAVIGAAVLARKQRRSDEQVGA
ncbi:MAG: NADH-quinone oxidoreductase subunit J [Actinomycetota bacterium]